MKRTRLLCLLAAALVACPLFAIAAQGGKSANISPEVSRVISWLPPNCETMWVVQKPFSVLAESSRNNLRAERSGIEKAFQNWNWLLIPNSESIEAQQVKILVHGARNFRSHEDIGVAYYDGCTILVFDEKARSSVKSLVELSKEDSVETISVEGCDILVFETEQKKHYFMASPAPGILVWGTQREFIKTIVSRSQSAVRNRVAFPNSLREWATVDTSADIWAVRHYNLSNPNHDYSSPLRLPSPDGLYAEKRAIGLTMSYNYGANTVKVCSISDDPYALKVRADGWLSNRFPGKTHVVVSNPSKDVLQVECPITQANTPDIILLLVGLLGHVVNI